MPDSSTRETSARILATEIAALAQEHGVRIAVAESLTSGALASALGMAPAAAEWFAGGVVAYTNNVKYDALGVRQGPVVTSSAALQMASGVAELTHSEFAVAVTGVGGPGSEEGKPAGTVHIAVFSPQGESSEEFRFDGEPGDIVTATIEAALWKLAATLGDYRQAGE